MHVFLPRRRCCITFHCVALHVVALYVRIVRILRSTPFRGTHSTNSPLLIRPCAPYLPPPPSLPFLAGLSPVDGFLKASSFLYANYSKDRQRRKSINSFPLSSNPGFFPFVVPAVERGGGPHSGRKELLTEEDPVCYFVCSSTFPHRGLSLFLSLSLSLRLRPPWHLSKFAGGFRLRHCPRLPP